MKIVLFVQGQEEIVGGKFLRTPESSHTHSKEAQIKVVSRVDSCNTLGRNL